MTTYDSGALQTAPTTDAPFTTHREPLEQGGAEYHRCTECGRELLSSLGGFDALIHADGCQHGDPR